MKRFLSFRKAAPAAVMAAVLLFSAGPAAFGAEQTSEPDTEQTAGSEVSAVVSDSASAPNREIPGLVYDHSMDLEYATCFSVDCYEGGYRLISIQNDADYLVVPEGGSVPENLPGDVTVLSLPLQSVYLAATSAMDFFDLLDRVDMVTLSGLQEDGWYSGKAQEAMKNGDMVFAGKYSEPDYETILSHGCDLAVESTMIYHKPQVKEKLEQLGIPVMVEHSSYESNPLGRSEWIKLYGVLAGCEEEAQQAFEQMQEKVEDVLKETGYDTGRVSEASAETESSGQSDTESAGKDSGADRNRETVTAFFSINSNGSATVYKTKGYVPKMIEMAGGQYAFQNLGDDNALSTVNLQMEEFYAGAKDADYLIYNSTIEGEIHSLAELTAKSSLLTDFKAVQEGNVWCTSAYLFQKPTGIADFIVDLYQMYQGDEDTDDYTYLYHIDD